MLLLVGLGNPGAEHANNRHNIGFMVMDALVRRYSFGAWRSRFHGLTAEGRIDGTKILALKPETFMNESGLAVGEAVRFHKLDLEDVIIFHDEIDLQPCKIRIKHGGGHAGHNGLRSIDAHIGKDYLRVRIGVGHPGEKDRVTGHVLNNFSKEELPRFEALVDAITDAVAVLVAGNEARFINDIALALAPPKPDPAAKPPPPAADTC
ncbi:MAG: aminoacyl-tRNA hydrolase [Alphaproteobacteria bacterium]